MKYLLDTHTFLWYLLGNPNLSNRAREIVNTRENLCFSIISLWEVSIKTNIGKLQLNRPFSELLEELKYINTQILPITFADTEIYINLPLHHRDPFDRILVAQAINHSLILISRDVAFDAYSIKRVWL